MHWKTVTRLGLNDVIIDVILTSKTCFPLACICTRFFGHVARTGDSHDLSRALHTSICGLPKDWRRRPGRLRHTWLRSLEADLQPLNHGLNSAWRHAQDRGRWKLLVETATLQSGACPRWWWYLVPGLYPRAGFYQNKLSWPSASMQDTAFMPDSASIRTFTVHTHRQRCYSDKFQTRAWGLCQKMIDI